MAGSTPESRQLVNNAVQRALAIGEALRVGRLQDLQARLGLDGALTKEQFVGTVRSMKFHPGYRRAASFTVSDRVLNPSTGRAREHDFVLTRHA